MGKRGRTPIDASTFEGRLRIAVTGSHYHPQKIAEACGKAAAQSIYDWWSPNKSVTPDPAALGVLAKMTGRSLDWLIYGKEEFYQGVHRPYDLNLN